LCKLSVMKIDILSSDGAACGMGNYPENNILSNPNGTGCRPVRRITPGTAKTPTLRTGVVRQNGATPKTINAFSYSAGAATAAW
ncbi:MAG: hypothetical protein ACYC38_13690, partial [Eubacteriales bacterium]